jgi:26S proteasome regulatory subunit N1
LFFFPLLTLIISRNPNNTSSEIAKSRVTRAAAVPVISAEDQALIDELTALVGTLTAAAGQLPAAALHGVAKHVQSATASMTAVPKPLKILMPHYDALAAHFGSLGARVDGADLRLFADLLSVLSMTRQSPPSAAAPNVDALRWKLQGNVTDLASWGSEYVRCLTAQLAADWATRSDAADPDARAAALAPLNVIVDQLVPYYVSQNAEPEACDLLLEVDRIEAIAATLDAANFERVCLYLANFAHFLPGPDDERILRLVQALYEKFGRLTEALRFAMRLHDLKAVKRIFAAVPKSERATRSQMAFMLGEQRMFILDDDPDAGGDDDAAAAAAAIDEDDEQRESLQRQINNAHLSEAFLVLAEDLDTLEPKQPEDIFKSHLETSRAGTTPANGAAGVDSARANLASTFVNAFVNAAYGHDKMMTDNVGHEWIYKNKEHGMMCAAASLGCVMLWDVDGALSQIDTLLEFSNEEWIKAGALLSVGIVNSGVRHEVDPALTLLSDYLDGKSNNGSLPVQLGSLLGLGLAYSGSARADVLELLLGVLESDATRPEALGHAAVALGLVFVGTGHALAVETLNTIFLDRDAKQLDSTHTRFVALGLGLLFLGRQDDAEVTLASLAAVPAPWGPYARVTVQTCAFAGTGNVLQVQELLHAIAEPSKKDDDAAAPLRDENEDGAAGAGGAGADPDAPASPAAQRRPAGAGAAATPAAAAGAAGAAGAAAAPAEEDGRAELGVSVIGIALIALGETVGAEMSRRMFEHVLQYGEPVVKRAVPLAIALAHLSNPDMYAIDTLSKLSHDASPAVAECAILALGLCSAGTNNARVATLLRNLAGYYQRAPPILFAVRVAQGLTHMGKGLMTLQPFTSGGLLLNKVALGGILVLLHAALDVEKLLLGTYAHLFFAIVTAMRPRMLITYDADGKVLNVPVRVGQAVDTVAQVGKPKTITGFQTHTTPVLLAHNERCELATDEYIAVASVLEQMVILLPNPDAPPKSAAQKADDERRQKERDEARKKRLERREKAAADNLSASSAAVKK